MKNLMRDFWRTNGFYVSFGLGIVALVAALAIYNVNSHRGTQNQNINLNEPAGSDIAKMDSTKDIELGVDQDGDLDVPMDMQQGTKNDSVAADSERVVSDGAARDDTAESRVIHDQGQGNTLFDEQEMGELIAAQNSEGESAGMSVSEDGENSDAELQETMADAEAAYAPLEGLTFLGMEEVSMPVMGNTILPYSMDTTVYYKTLGLYRCNPGMLLQAPVGADVVSIWHGQVTDIQDSKEYGRMVTVNLGSGYEMIYGQLQDVRVAVGDEVYQDTILGTVAEPTAYYQEEGSHVFFEVKKDGTPIDPLDILQLE